MFSWITALALTLPAATSTVPPEMQAFLFKKLLAYDYVLKGSIKILVAHANNEPAAKELFDAFKRTGLDVQMAQTQDLEKSVDEINVVYFLPGADTPSSRSLCEERKILSITGTKEAVENGFVSIGLGINEGKPQIVVNLKRVKAEGHQLSSQLLVVSKVL
jgi:hypothetical protein